MAPSKLAMKVASLHLSNRSDIVSITDISYDFLIKAEDSLTSFLAKIKYPEKMTRIEKQQLDLIYEKIQNLTEELGNITTDLDTWLIEYDHDSSFRKDARRPPTWDDYAEGEVKRIDRDV